MVEKSSSALQDAVAFTSEEQKVLNEAKLIDNEMSEMLNSSLSYLKTDYYKLSFKDFISYIAKDFPVGLGIGYQVYLYDINKKSACDQLCVPDLRDAFADLNSRSLQQVFEQYKSKQRVIPDYLYRPEDVRFIISYKINAVSCEINLIEQLLGFSLWEVLSQDSQLFILNLRDEERAKAEEIQKRLSVNVEKK